MTHHNQEPTTTPEAPATGKAEVMVDRAPDVAGSAPVKEQRAHAALFPEEQLRGYRTRWDAIQTGFVDQPRAAVEQADGLVSEMMKQLSEAFAHERTELERQWDRGDRISTEDLRVALKRYRSFFERLLAV